MSFDQRIAILQTRKAKISTARLADADKSGELYEALVAKEADIEKEIQRAVNSKNVANAHANALAEFAQRQSATQTSLQAKYGKEVSDLVMK